MTDNKYPSIDSSNDLPKEVADQLAAQQEKAVEHEREQAEAMAETIRQAEKAKGAEDASPDKPLITPEDLSFLNGDDK